MKTVIKLLIALAVVNAVYRGGAAAMAHYELKDEAQQLITFGSTVPTAQITYLILDKAVELGVPLEAENIAINRANSRTVVNVSYTKPVEFFPAFIYPLELSFMVEAISLNPSNVE